MSLPQALHQKAVSPLNLIILDRNGQGLLGTHQNQEAFRPGDRCVQEVSLEHHEMLGQDGKNNRGIFASLGLVD